MRFQAIIMTPDVAVLLDSTISTILIVLFITSTPPQPLDQHPSLKIQQPRCSTTVVAWNMRRTPLQLQPINRCTNTYRGPVLVITREHPGYSARAWPRRSRSFTPFPASDPPSTSGGGDEGVHDREMPLRSRPADHRRPGRRRRGSEMTLSPRITALAITPPHPFPA